MLTDPMPPQIDHLGQRGGNVPPTPIDVSPQPVSIDELLLRSQMMLQNIQAAFLQPDPGMDPRAAKAAVAAASPLLKLILDKAPQRAESRHALFEDLVVEVLQEADELYKQDFLERLKTKLEQHSLRLKNPL